MTNNTKIKSVESIMFGALVIHIMCMQDGSFEFDILRDGVQIIDPGEVKAHGSREQALAEAISEATLAMTTKELADLYDNAKDARFSQQRIRSRDICMIGVIKVEIMTTMAGKYGYALFHGEERIDRNFGYHSKQTAELEARIRAHEFMRKILCEEADAAPITLKAKVTHVVATYGLRSVMAEIIAYCAVHAADIVDEYPENSEAWLRARNELLSCDAHVSALDLSN